MRMNNLQYILDRFESEEFILKTKKKTHRENETDQLTTATFLTNAESQHPAAQLRFARPKIPGIVEVPRSCSPTARRTRIRVCAWVVVVCGEVEGRREGESGEGGGKGGGGGRELSSRQVSLQAHAAMGCVNSLISLFGSVLGSRVAELCPRGASHPHQGHYLFHFGSGVEKWRGLSPGLMVALYSQHTTTTPVSSCFCHRVDGSTRFPAITR